MPTCYCNDCEDKRRTDVHLATNTNADIRTTYSELIEEGTVIRIDGQGFYYSNVNPFNDRLDGEWVGDKGDVISAKKVPRSHPARRPRTRVFPLTLTHH